MSIWNSKTVILPHLILYTANAKPCVLTCILVVWRAPEVSNGMSTAEELYTENGYDYYTNQGITQWFLLTQPTSTAKKLLPGWKWMSTPVWKWTQKQSDRIRSILFWVSFFSRSRLNSLEVWSLPLCCWLTVDNSIFWGSAQLMRIHIMLCI